jgi:hypothetical protein
MTLTSRKASRLKLLALSVLVAGIAFAPAPVTTRAEDAPPLPVTHHPFNFVQGAPVAVPNAGGAVGNYRHAPSPICSTPTSVDPNVNTDCEGVAPHNETTIAVNPTNPLNMIAGANDYQITANRGGAVKVTLFSRAHVTFDGGRTWTLYPIDFNGYSFTGDPALSFDADGTAYYATLGFLVPQGNGCCTNPDILVAHSTDGGRNWSRPSHVYQGTGNFSSPGIANDKEYVTAWGHGNAIVTWTVFNQGPHGSYISSPIYASVTHDGGRTWSQAALISGDAPFCIGAQGGTSCDQSQASVPVVAADGSIYVAFLNTADIETFRDQYLVVKVDPATGQRVAGPYRVGGVVDGATDYPINQDGSPTYQDSQFRTWAAGNITADPTNAQHLAVVWSDMRNSTLPAPADPYQATTNSDTIVSQSMNGGATWSAPSAIAAPRDQFMPWGAYDTTGRLRIGYFDRSYDPANHQYGYTLATETAPGSLSFTTASLTTQLSDPTRNDAWFSGVTVNPTFPRPTAFLGDYSGIVARPGGGVAALWTDMRVTTCFAGTCGWGENAFFATAP